MKVFAAVWDGFPTTVRRRLVQAMAELAEATFEVNFDSIFRYSLDDPDARVRAVATDGLWESEDVALVGPLLAKLRADYDAWFDDVKSSRNFTPGYIHIGSDEEDPIHLCRYQDSSYIVDKPTGWPVYIERAGKYEFTINRGQSVEKGKMHLKINGKETTQPHGYGENKAVFELPCGYAKFEVWVQEEGKGRFMHTKNYTIGDVDLKRMD